MSDPLPSCIALPRKVASHHGLLTATISVAAIPTSEATNTSFCPAADGSVRATFSNRRLELRPRAAAAARACLPAALHPAAVHQRGAGHAGRPLFSWVCFACVSGLAFAVKLDIVTCSVIVPSQLGSWTRRWVVALLLPIIYQTIAIGPFVLLGVCRRLELCAGAAAATLAAPASSCCLPNSLGQFRCSRHGLRAVLEHFISHLVIR